MRRALHALFPWPLLAVVLLALPHNYPDRRPPGPDPTSPVGSAWCGKDGYVVPSGGRCPICNQRL